MGLTCFSLYFAFLVFIKITAKMISTTDMTAQIIKKTPPTTDNGTTKPPIQKGML